MQATRINAKKKQLGIEYLSLTQQLFSIKKWPIEDPFGESVFDRFCKMLIPLNDDQRKLLLSLSNDFLWVHESEYAKLFADVFNRFVSNYSFYMNSICICPLLPEYDFGKAKSSVALLYSIKCFMKNIQIKYSNINISYVDSPNNIQIEKIKHGLTLCLVDDFIGTGSTANDAVRFFVNKGVSPKQIVIISLVAMSEGIENIRNGGINIYTSICCRKGITGTSNAENKRLIMQSIEDSIGVKERFRFGLGASESLVKMRRTPNNTFPVYWLDSQRNCAPFPR